MSAVLRAPGTLILAVLIACGTGVHHPVRPAPVDDVTLYRDTALVRQRLVLALPAGPSSVSSRVAAGVTGDQLVVVDRGDLELRALRVAAPTSPAAASRCRPAARCAELVEPATEVVLDVSAPHAGTYAVVVAYTTRRLQWDADYTMTTTPARDHAVLRGAIAVRNTTAVAFDHAAVHVIDADLAGWRARTTEHLADTLVGGTASTTPAAVPRDLGVATLVTGETRIELDGIAAPRAMHSVLVYDPIGTRLDRAQGTPVRDDRLGVDPPAPTRVSESFEIQRTEHDSAGLPAGPVRLLERRPGGELAVLGESRLFDAATRVAEVDTISVGTAEGVTGHRERRELTIDDARQRLTEEFVITLDNARDHPVGVLVREHLYRGQNWNVAYESSKRPRKEGAQQFSMRSTVPANRRQKILYVVVYTWSAP